MTQYVNTLLNNVIELICMHRKRSSILQYSQLGNNNDVMATTV